MESNGANSGNRSAWVSVGAMARTSWVDGHGVNDQSRRDRKAFHSVINDQSLVAARAITFGSKQPDTAESQYSNPSALNPKLLCFRSVGVRVSPEGLCVEAVFFSPFQPLFRSPQTWMRQIAAVASRHCCNFTDAVTCPGRSTKLFAFQCRKHSPVSQLRNSTQHSRANAPPSPCRQCCLE